MTRREDTQTSTVDGAAAYERWHADDLPPEMTRREAAYDELMLARSRGQVVGDPWDPVVYVPLGDGEAGR